MSELRELYQEVILDHGRRPRNFGALEPHSHEARGDNPLCGDKIEVFLLMDGDNVADVKFRGQGCAISTASASLMTEALKGRTRDEALALFEAVHDMIAGGAEGDPAVLGKLAVFTGVREFPLRVKCATLAWHTMRNALTSEDGATAEVATTE
jgi:nitrogen fixation NifU-like protein